MTKVTTAAMADAVGTTVPDASAFDSQGKVTFVGISDVRKNKAHRRPLMV